MNYREFVNQVSEDLKEVLPEKLQSATITPHQVDKLQGASYYGISIQSQGSPVGISMDLSSPFKQMENGKSYPAVLAEIAASVLAALVNHPKFKIAELLDYEAMKNKLMIQVVPAAGNERMLATVPHMDQEDISLVYRFVFQTDEQGSVSSLITNSMLESYGVTAEQLHMDALENAPEQFPASVRSLQEVLAEQMGFDSEVMPHNLGGMYVATCNNGINGAGCIFYPEFMDQAADKLGGSFFVLPSSVHEVILLLDTGDMSYRDLESIVREINTSMLKPEDQLSDSVYHYDAEARIFEKAAAHNMRLKTSMAEQEYSHEKKSIAERLAEKKNESHALAGEKPSPVKTAVNSL